MNILWAATWVCSTQLFGTQNLIRSWTIDWRPMVASSTSPKIILCWIARVLHKAPDHYAPRVQGTCAKRWLRPCTITLVWSLRKAKASVSASRWHLWSSMETMTWTRKSLTSIWKGTLAWQTERAQPTCVALWNRMEGLDRSWYIEACCDMLAH